LFFKAKLDDSKWDEINRRVIGLTQAGETDQALKVAEDLLAITRKHYGKKHRHTVITMGNLGMVHMIRQDLDNSNPMRPWRIINLNYCIIATRSHDTALMEKSYDVLIKNLPHDAREFFKEGMQQMDIIGYTQEVRAVVEKYDGLWGSGSTLH